MDHLSTKQTSTIIRLYKTYYRKLIRTALMVIVNNEPDYAKAKDLADIVVIDTILNVAKGDYLAKVEAGKESDYLVVCVINDAIRQIKRHCSNSSNGEVLNQLPDSYISFGSESMEIQLTKLENQLGHFLETCTITQRQIFDLRVEKNLKFKEIGDKLNKSEATCRVIFNRLEIRIRSMIQQTNQ